MKQAGFSIVEIIIAIAVFVLLSSSTAGLIFSGEDLAKTNSTAYKALLYAREGLEALRAMRDGSWESLIQGDHGLMYEGGSWLFSGNSDILENKYRRTVTLEMINQDKFRAISRVSWFNRTDEEKDISLSTYLTNWQRERQQSGVGLDLGDSAKDIYVSGNYTYLAVDNQHKSLVIADTSNPLSPQVIATKDLSGKGRDVWVSGNYAYVALDTNKIKILNISNPANPVQVASINVSAQPSSVYVYNNYLYVGQLKNNEGLVLYNVANPQYPYFYGSFNIEGLKVYDVKVVNGYIYMAVRAGRGFDVSDEGSYAYAYVAVDAADGGFEIYYLKEKLIELRSVVNVGSPGSNVYYHNDIAYLAAKDGDSGLVKLNVSSVFEPIFVSAYDIQGEGNGVFYKDGYAYMAVQNSGAGFYIVDVE